MKKLVSSILLVGLLAGTVSAGASFAMDPDPKKPGQNMAMHESEDSSRNRGLLTKCLDFVENYLDTTDVRLLNEKRKLEVAIRVELAKDNIEKVTVNRCIEKTYDIFVSAYLLQISKMEPKKVLEGIIENINFHKGNIENMELSALCEMTAIKMFAEVKLENPDFAQINIHDLARRQVYYHVKCSLLEALKALQNPDKADK